MDADAWRRVRTFSIAALVFFGAAAVLLVVQGAQGWACYGPDSEAQCIGKSVVWLVATGFTVVVVLVAAVIALLAHARAKRVP
ncbi:MAG: hypothetical protein ACYDCK_06045 [Thermoplasmatota archaeon]